MKELWKNHPLLPADIEVSNRGRIFSPKRDIPIYACPKTGRMWTRLRSTKDGLATSFQVARLVGELFCPDYHPRLRAAFRDGNPANCSTENLVWISVSEKTKRSLTRTPC